MNKLEITLFEKLNRNVHLSMGSVACRFDVGAFLCLLLQNHTALGVWAAEFSLFSSFPSFLNPNRLICPTSAEGGNDFWAAVREMFLCLAVSAGSAHEWDVTRQFWERSFSCPQLVLLLGDMWWEERSFKAKENQMSWCALSTALFWRRVLVCSSCSRN